MTFSRYLSDGKDLLHLVDIAFAGQLSWGGASESKAELEERLGAAKTGKKTLVIKDSTPAAFSMFLPEKHSYNPRPKARDDSAHLAAFYLQTDYWGSGLALELMEWTAEEMLRSGFVQARLWTPAVAERARAFYEKEGWKESGRTFVFADLVRVEYTCKL